MLLNALPLIPPQRSFLLFRTGQQIGIYTLINRIGRGGFGEVWLAERRAKFVTTKVAVKLPHDEQVDHEAIKQEATLWEQASGHPNILPIIDADEYDGQIVIVSEYAPDGSLEEWLNKNGKMTPEKAAELSVEILAGLEFLHARKIIHRDLKPANILLQGNTPRLTDFGISRALRTTIASQTHHISGTFAYMSPEALDGKRSVQTDIWAVGVNLYRFLSGTLPFPQKEPSVLFPAIIMREYEPLPDSVPDALRRIVSKALAKQPPDRYQTATEMRTDLIRFVRRVTGPSPEVTSQSPSLQAAVNPVNVVTKPTPVATAAPVPLANETQTAVRPISHVRVSDRVEVSPQAVSTPDSVKPRRFEIEVPQSKLRISEATLASFVPVLMWGAVGVVSGLLCGWVWRWGFGLTDTSPWAYPGIIFGIAICAFGEFSSTPLVRRRRRLLAIPLMIALSGIGSFLAVVTLIYFHRTIGFGYFAAGVVWSTFIVVGELLCWRFKFSKWLYALCMLMVSASAAFIGYAIADMNAEPIFLIAQPLVLIAHVIAFGKRWPWIVSTTAALLLVSLWLGILILINANNPGTSAESNANYTATPMPTLETPRSVQFAQTADAFYNQGNYAEAERNYREATSLDPKNDAYHNALGNSLYGQRKYPEAELEYRLAISLKPGTAVYHENLGDSFYARENYGEAARAYRDTINIETLNYRYYNKLGTSLTGQELHEEAEKQFRTAISLNAGDAQVHCNLGDSLNSQEKYAEAEAPLREAIRLNGKNYDFYNRLGISLFGQRKYPAAESAFKNSVRLRSNVPVLHSNVGDSLYEQYKCTEAQSAYERALKLDPNSSSFKAKLQRVRERKAAMLGFCP